jgi:hypothetical protein
MIVVSRDNKTVRLPQVSQARLKLFTLSNKSYLRRHFRRIAVLKSGLPRIFSQPTVVYLNHPSWWDPLVCLFLSRCFFADRVSFAPMDAAMLERYGFFRHLGFFGVERDAIRGASNFLRTSRALLASSRNMLWITPQGRFADVRERPLRLQTGLATIAGTLPGVVFVPLAMEYSFWTESRPEILVSFGRCLTFNGKRRIGTAQCNHILSDALEDTQDNLATAVCRRNPRDFLTIHRGQQGGNRIYDVSRRLKAWARGQSFAAEHQRESNE